MPKLQRIDADMTYLGWNSACMGCMGSEDVYMTFRADDGAEYRWWGGNANVEYWRHRPGERMHVTALVVPDGRLNRLRRIKLVQAEGGR